MSLAPIVPRTRQERGIREIRGRYPVLKRRADQLDSSLQRDIDRLDAHREEALSAVQKAADARTKQIQWKIHTLKEQASLEIARIGISSPGKWLSDEITAAECYAVNGDPMKEAQSRYLGANVRRS